MSARAFRVVFAVTVAAFLCVVRSQPRVSAEQATTTAESPEDLAGRAVLEAQCSACHEANLVQGPYRAPDEWNELLDRMSSYGADVNPTVRPQLLTFLLKNFGKVRVNAAPAAELAPVLDITREVADAVVAYRTERGPFKTLDELKAVPGLDAARVDKRKDRLVF